jgi:hypothetical protein
MGIGAQPHRGLRTRPRAARRASCRLASGNDLSGGARVGVAPARSAWCLVAVSRSSRVSPPLGGDRRFTTRTRTHCWARRLWWLGRCRPGARACRLVPCTTSAPAACGRNRSRAWSHESDRPRGTRAEWQRTPLEHRLASTARPNASSADGHRRSGPAAGAVDLCGGSSRRRLPSLVTELEAIDVFIHDSMHTTRNLLFELETVWPAVRPGGLILVDDVNLNRGFEVFTGRRGRNLRALVGISDDGERLLGLIRKKAGA